MFTGKDEIVKIDGLNKCVVQEYTVLLHDIIRVEY